MMQYDEMHTVARLMDTDPVSHMSHPIAIRRFVRHLVATAQSLRHFDVTTTESTRSNGERTYAMSCDLTQGDQSSVIITVHHHHPIYSGSEMTPRRLTIHTSLHIDGQMLDHRTADASDMSQQMQCITNIAKHLHTALRPIPAQ